MAWWSVKAARIDLACYRLPHALTARIYAAGCIFALTVPSEPANQWLALWLGIVLLHTLLVALPPHGLGGGDLRLVAGLAIPTAIWGSVQLFLWTAYVTAAVAGLWKRRRPGATHLAFGPYLVAGWSVAVMGECARVALAYSR